MGIHRAVSRRPIQERSRRPSVCVQLLRNGRLYSQIFDSTANVGAIAWTAAEIRCLRGRKGQAFSNFRLLRPAWVQCLRRGTCVCDAAAAVFGGKSGGVPGWLWGTTRGPCTRPHSILEGHQPDPEGHQPGVSGNPSGEPLGAVYMILGPY